MKLSKIILMLFCAHLFAREITVHVVDDLGVSVAGAKSSIFFVNSREDDERAGLTDKVGVFSANGDSSNSFGFIIAKDGYYSARVGGLAKDMDHNVEVSLPRKVNPIPLYALRCEGSEGFDFPLNNVWVGFDFEVADWVVPHGKGRTADILLRFKNEYKGLKDSRMSLNERIEFHKSFYLKRNEEWTMEKFQVSYGKWDGVLEVSFPNQGDGIFEEKRFLEYSQLKMPHMAPEDGYVATWRYEASNYHYKPRREKVGFFLRTRVKRDLQGGIVSANYAKFIGDLNVDAATGRLEFVYYFNPAPNNRNLEFDPKKNLFPSRKPGAKIYEP
jgi:hypothetical protein